MTMGLPTTALQNTKRTQTAYHSVNADCFPGTKVLHQFAESLGAAVDAKDKYTWQHSEEVARVSYVIALSIGFSKREADFIQLAGHLHDIGKIGIPDAVLFKSGKLTPSEWGQVREHPVIGAAILQPVPSLVRSGVVEIVLHHHERFDGKGYPHGLCGTSIPIGARIVALADSVSAMLQDRPYRKACTFKSAAAEIERMAGTQFDPAVVAGFIRSKVNLRELMHALRNEQQRAA